MLYWLIYDISENKIRGKIASKCKNYGLFRVQKSSFIGNLSKNKAEMLVLEIKELSLNEPFKKKPQKTSFSYNFINAYF